MKKFFLYKSKNNEEGIMKKDVAISLLKSENLSAEQRNAIIGSVAESERASLLSVVKGNDPENNAMVAVMAQFMPAMIKQAITDSMKKEDSETSSDSGNVAEMLKEILEKLDELLSSEENEDEDLSEAIKEAEEEEGETYKSMKKKWEDGTLEDSESKEYMKAKTKVRKKARAAYKAKKVKAEKEAIAALTGSEIAENDEGGTREEDVKKVFSSEDREITDPVEIANLMRLATEGVENGSL